MRIIYEKSMQYQMFMFEIKKKSLIAENPQLGLIFVCLRFFFREFLLF